MTKIIKYLTRIDHQKIRVSWQLHKYRKVLGVLIGPNGKIVSLEEKIMEQMDKLSKENHKAIIHV